MRGTCAAVLASWVVCLLCVVHAYLCVRAKPVDICDSLPLMWYLDEESHTGDLVFFKRPDAGLLHRIVSPMTHVAIVVMHPTSGEPWLVETHDDKAVRGHGAGVHAYPARPRLLEFKGELFVVRIQCPLSAARVMRAVDGLRTVPYMSRGMHRYFATCKLLPEVGVCRPPGMVCSELVLHILNQLGILTTAWHCATPSDVLHMAANSDSYVEPCRLTD